NLLKVVIPRPDPSGAPVTGVGKLLFEYANVDGSTWARIGMHAPKVVLWEPGSCLPREQVCC
ncbi:hypothetical protein EJB05_03062, partial [Eragrostis curvula]